MIISFSSTARIKLELIYFITIISLVHSSDVIKGVDNHVTDRVQHAVSYNVVEELGGAMALVSICVLPNHATFMTDTLDATLVTSILFVCANSNVCTGSTMHFMCFQVLHKLWSTLIK